MASEARDQYEDFATQYDTLTTVPESVIEGQLVTAALGSVDGKTVLDLAGGSGIHARQALKAGASQVDLVDISSEMVKIAQNAEQEHGRKDTMRFFVADVAGDLSNIGLHEHYDIVMVNWLLDHATSEADLDAFWKNIAKFTKPGGKLICTRMTDLATSAWNPKYGISFENIRRIPGGTAYKVVVHSKPPFEFEGTSMDTSASGSTTMQDKYGFKDTVRVRSEDLDVVKSDPEFWKMYVNKPFFVCETATKI